jgi:hypothetical protein
MSETVSLLFVKVCKSSNTLPSHVSLPTRPRGVRIEKCVQIYGQSAQNQSSPVARASTDSSMRPSLRSISLRRDSSASAGQPFSLSRSSHHP